MGPDAKAPPNRAHMGVTQNAVAQTINASTEIHGLVATGMVADHLERWTFQAGTVGTISTIANDTDGKILVTTGAVHGLSVDEIIAQNNTGDVNYNGLFKVQTVPSTTTYTVVATWGSTATGMFQRPDSLIAGPTVRGHFVAEAHMSGSAAGAQNVFDFWVTLNAAVTDHSEQRRKFGGAGDVGAWAMSDSFDVVPGDRVGMALSNVGASADYTMRNIHVLITYQDAG